MAVSPSNKPEALNEGFDREAYSQAAAHTLVTIHNVVPPAELTRYSNRPISEVEELQKQVAEVIPAGNIVGLVLGGLIRLRERTLPPEQVKSDVSALMRGLEMLPRHILPQTLYGTFFIGPAAVLSGYQKLLTLAGKDVDSAFPEGLWQFYLEFALREDSARHANETTGFHRTLAELELNPSPSDQLAAWVCAVSQLYFQYDDLLQNEWRERVYLHLVQQAAEVANLDHSLAFRQLRQAWAAQRSYQRGPDAAPDENYAMYRRRRFDKFLQSRLEALPPAQRTWVKETYLQRVDSELGAYQQQMTILATLDPDRYRENRTPLPLWQARVGIIHQGCYFLIPVCHTNAVGQLICFETPDPDSRSRVLSVNAAGDLCDSSGRILRVERTGQVYEVDSGRQCGYLHPLPFQSVRRYITTLFDDKANPNQRVPARLDDQLIAIQRTEQERARKVLSTPGTRLALTALKCAPVLINWDEQNSSLPLAHLRRGKRGIGDHALTIFHTERSLIFDQSHIFFDGVWGMAVAEILTNEAIAWAAYFSSLTPPEPIPQPPQPLSLAAEPALEKFPKVTTMELSAENTGIDVKALYSLRKLLSKRHPDMKMVNTVNDLLVLYRSHFGLLYHPSTQLEDALFELRTQNTLEALSVGDLINDMLAKAQAENPSILLPMDASANNPRERLCPTTFRNPFSQLWAKYQLASSTLDRYLQQQTSADWATFSEARYALLVQLDHFGQLLQAHKRVALGGESTSTATMRLLAHLPDSVLKLLDEIPRRIDVLNEVIKGDEVFSNVGRVARGSTLSRFISAKDDNENKMLVWGILTDDNETMCLTVRDFRPHVAALHQLDLSNLAELILQEYLDTFVKGFNQFVTRLLEILQATATHTTREVNT